MRIILLQSSFCCGETTSFKTAIFSDTKVSKSVVRQLTHFRRCGEIKLGKWETALHIVPPHMAQYDKLIFVRAEALSAALPHGTKNRKSNEEN